MENRIIIEPEVKVPFFILLHQLGRDEEDLLFLKDSLPKNSFILAIRGPHEWNFGESFGFAWFHLRGNNLETFSDVNDIEMSVDYIKSIINDTMENYPLLDEPIFIGVSQGSVVALHSCFENKVKCKAVISLLGFYEFRLDTQQSNDTPILMINGLTDNVIPIDWVQLSQRHLKEKNKNVTNLFLNTGHEITKEMVDISTLWIHNLLK